MCLAWLADTQRLNVEYTKSVSAIYSLARISVVLLSRIILNLRQQNDTAGDIGPGSHSSSPLRPVIAPRILGNLTAELRNSESNGLHPEKMYMSFLHIK